MKKKILIIDDDRLVLKTVRNILEKVGYEAVCASGGDEALKVIQEAPFHLIICDIRMPGRDGITVIESLKAKLKENNTPQIPVIFTTGYASEEAPISAIKLGASDYLLKPLDLNELLKSVHAHIK